MKKFYDYILIFFGSFIIGYSNHFESLFTTCIMWVIGLVLVIYGAQHVVTKFLYNRINTLKFYSEIQEKFINALEHKFNHCYFLLSIDELKEYKSFIELYRKKFGNIIYKIEYTLDKDINEFYKCQFVKAYDMKDKEWIDEQYKTIHLFKHIGLFEFFNWAFLHNEEIPIEFDHKKYICKVTSLMITDEMNENNDKMMEIELDIINKLDE